LQILNYSIKVIINVFYCVIIDQKFSWGRYSNIL